MKKLTVAPGWGASVSEAHIQQTVTEFMESDGWRHLRTDPVSDRATVAAIRRKLCGMKVLAPVLGFILAAIDTCVRGKGFGESGMPDDLFIRYQSGKGQGQLAELIWIEFKAPSKLPAVHQLVWHDVERSRGAMVKVVDNIDRYIAWYEAAGLVRRVLKSRK